MGKGPPLGFNVKQLSCADCGKFPESDETTHKD